MTAALRFVKMSGAGNDFVVVGPEEMPRIESQAPAWARRLCRRGTSVGADGLVLVEPIGTDLVRVRFHNPDGSEAFCGNGSRCAARFAHVHGMAGHEMRLETINGTVPAVVQSEHVRLQLPPPSDAEWLTVDLEGERLAGVHIEAGVPHFVVFVEDPDRVPLERWGPRARRHPRFAPRGSNLDVCCPIDESTLRVRTWERGVERETLACGSGAVAVAWAARLRGAGPTLRIVPQSRSPLDVELRGDARRPDCAFLGGEARIVFEGRLAFEPIPEKASAGSDPAEPGHGE